MLATPRRLLLALVALAASTPVLFGGVICIPNGDGSWTCSGDGGYDPDQPTTVVTNILGVCTNCVAMDPIGCQSIKLDLSYYQGEALSESHMALMNVNDTISAIQGILSEGDSFLPPSSYSAKDWQYVASSAQGQYALSGNGTAPSGSSSAWFPAANSIANYYQQGVKPQLESCVSYLQDSSSSLNVTIDDLERMENSINAINCSACTASWGGDTPSGGGGGGSSSCPDCPCKEQIEALHNLLKNDFLPKVKRIDENVEKLKELVETAKKQLETTKQGFGNVTNLFNRLDDYVLDDFSNRVYQIRYDVNFIASNLAQNVQRIFIDQSYSNAQFYVRQDSDTPVKMADLDETLIPEGDVSKFDWGEFENLSWFTRVEYLLLKLNGVYVSTNDNSNAGIDEAKDKADEIVSSSDNVKSIIEGSVKSGFTRVGQSALSFFNSFHSAVGSSADSVTEIHLMSNFIGQEPLILKIDRPVVNFCRAISSLLWSVGFATLLYGMILKFWGIFVEFIQFFIRQTQGFVK